MGVSVMPVESGLVDSYARPGANVTGVDWFAPERYRKNYQLLKEAVPGAKRAAQLIFPGPILRRLGEVHLREVSSRIGLGVVSVEMARSEDLAGALDQIAASRAEVLLVAGHYVITPHFREICEFAMKRKVVSLSEHGEFLRAGGLLYYGPVVSAGWDRVASLIDRILRGAKPGDLPVEQPSKYELLVNGKVARIIGVTFPDSFMLRVDKVFG
jgi:putative ABC transport system substrate-binding protein